jgi:hypothetical protein
MHPMPAACAAGTKPLKVCFPSLERSGSERGGLPSVNTGRRCRVSTKRATDSESISTVPAPGIRGYQVVLSLAEREATEKITAPDAADRSGQRPPRPGDAERPPAHRRVRKVIVTGIIPPIFSRQFAALLQL